MAEAAKKPWADFCWRKAEAEKKAKGPAVAMKAAPEKAAVKSPSKAARKTAAKGQQKTVVKSAKQPVAAELTERDGAPVSSNRGYC